LVFLCQVPGCGRSSCPLYDRGVTTPMFPLSRAEHAAPGRETGPVKGFARHHASPCSDCCSVALLVRLSRFPREGGAGRKEVSGTAVCQSWWGCWDISGLGEERILDAMEEDPAMERNSERNKTKEVGRRSRYYEASFCRILHTYIGVAPSKLGNLC
jgi:hypothetical protein